jgi:hypothetical protein
MAKGTGVGSYKEMSRGNKKYNNIKGTFCNNMSQYITGKSMELCLQCESGKNMCSKLHFVLILGLYKEQAATHLVHPHVTRVAWLENDIFLQRNDFFHFS